MEVTNPTNICADKGSMEIQNSNELSMTRIKEEVLSIFDNIDIKEEPIDDTDITNETIDKIIKTESSKVDTHKYISIKCEPGLKSEHDKQGDTLSNNTMKTEYIEYLSDSDLKLKRKQRTREFNSVTGGINLIESESCQEYKSRGRKGVFKVETGKKVQASIMIQNLNKFSKRNLTLELLLFKMEGKTPFKVQDVCKGHKTDRMGTPIIAKNCENNNKLKLLNLKDRCRVELKDEIRGGECNFFLELIFPCNIDCENTIPKTKYNKHMALYLIGFIFDNRRNRPITRRRIPGMLPKVKLCILNNKKKEETPDHRRSKRNQGIKEN